MSYNLFLDDIRQPKDAAKYIGHPKLIPLYLNKEWVVVKNYDEFVKCVNDNGMPDIVSFDHDLADEHYRPSMYNEDGHYSNYYSDGTFKEKTGYDCAKYLKEIMVDKCIKPKLVVCHSMNPIGKVNIMSLFN